jgi:hypothetical protein
MVLPYVEGIDLFSHCGPLHARAGLRAGSTSAASPIRQPE